MANFRAHILSDPADEEPSMTVNGAFLTAHHCNVVLIGKLEEMVYSDAKAIRFRHFAVEDVTFSVIHRIFRRSPTERLAGEPVPDAYRFEGRLEGVLVEIAGVSGIWLRSNVND